MPEIVGYALYVPIKLAAYVAWCWVGIRWFAPSRTPAFRAAMLFGLGRLFLGIALGLFIFFAALSMNNATRNAPLTYAAIYVPVRVCEWLLWYFLLRTVPGGRRAALWVAGGVLVSCLADIPIGILEKGVVPVGRPFC